LELYLSVKTPKKLSSKAALKENSDLSFSVKSRAGLHEEDKPEQLDFLKNIAPSCDLISIHGRTLKQLYTGDADF